MPAMSAVVAADDCRSLGVARAIGRSSLSRYLTSGCVTWKACSPRCAASWRPNAAGGTSCSSINNVPAAVTFSDARDVDTVLVAGEFRKRDGKLIGHDTT